MLFRPSFKRGERSLFTGIDIKMTWERIYWESSKGQIVRTVRKQVSTVDLPGFFVATFQDVKGYERAVKLDKEGYYDCGDVKLLDYLELVEKKKSVASAATIEP
jgi:hypothetical protein